MNHDAINWVLAFLGLSRHTTKPWRTTQRRDNPWLAKGQQSDWPSILSLAWAIFHIMERYYTCSKNVLPHIRSQCACFWYATPLLHIVMLQGARRHDASVRSLSVSPVRRPFLDWEAPGSLPGFPWSSHTSDLKWVSITHTIPWLTSAISDSYWLFLPRSRIKIRPSLVLYHRTVISL